MNLFAIIKTIWGAPKDWEHHPLWPTRRLMRRKINGRWEYREPTEEDIKEFQSADGW